MGIFDLFYKSKEAKDYCRDVKLFDEKDLEQINKISNLETENKRLRKALEFYADDMNWHTRFSEKPSPSYRLIAQEALKPKDD